MKIAKISLVLLILVVLASCSKEEITEPKVSKLNDLTAPAQFSWSTGKVVELEITGLPTNIFFQSTLSIASLNGDIYYSGMYDLSKDLHAQLILPSTETEVIMSYGKLTKNLPIAGSKIVYSFIPVE